MLQQTLTAGCEHCGRGGSAERPPCRNLADMRSWTDAGDETCASALDERLAFWTLAGSASHRIPGSFSR